MELIIQFIIILLSATIGFLLCSIITIDNLKEVNNVCGVTFNDGIENVTLEDCIQLNASGIDVIMNEGTEITFQIN